MRSTVSDAWVLRTVDLGDFDRIVVLLTAEHGRVDAFAAGARRLKNRFGAALEPLSLVRASWRQRPRRDLARLASAELKQSSYRWLTDPSSFESFTEITRLVEALALAGEANPTLFRLVTALTEAGAAAAGADDALSRLVRYAEVWTCRLGGFWPTLDTCAACGKRVDGTRLVGPGTEGALCRPCGRGFAGLQSLAAEGAKLARQILHSPPLELVGTPCSRRALGEVSRVARSLLSYHLEREFRPPRGLSGGWSS